MRPEPDHRVEVRGIAPSLLTADLARLGEEATALEAAGADRIHWDVMDGRFVPNITFGPDVVAAARAHTTLPFEAHLMVAEPDHMIHRWAEAGCALITVHVEAVTHLHRTLDAIAGLLARAGVALNPSTPPSAVDYVLDLVDLVLVMTVNPGFGGQRYLSGMEEKVACVRALARRTEREIEIEVDGGINGDTVGHAWRAGADDFVCGSALFTHPDGPRAAIRAVRDECGAASARPMMTASQPRRIVAVATRSVR